MTAPGTSPRSTPPPATLLLAPPTEWRDDAACANHPTLPRETWDDVPSAGVRETHTVRQERVGRAKAVCRTECPVREQCLRDIDLRYDEGVHGGEDIRDIKAAIRRAARRSA